MADTTLTGILSTTFVDKPDDVLSAKTYADAAANAANAASTSENNAATSEANLKKSETAAKTSETNAASSATAAATSETNAASSKTAAATSASAAASSATAAAQSEVNASTYEQQAKSQADAAITTVATLTYATDAEATAGTATDRMISPATLKAVVDAAVKEATAAIEKQAKLDAHPVGSYYFSDDSTSPTDLFGGTWEALPAGYTLIAQGSGSDDFGSYTYTAGQKYGERQHKLTTDELPKITGNAQFRLEDGNQNIVGNMNDNPSASGAFSYIRAGGSKWAGTMQNGPSSTSNTDVLHLEFGKNQPHNTLSPSIACYGWRRTA